MNAVSSVDAQPIIWISYTTEYRDCGPKFQRVAATMARELAEQHPACEVICEATESKAAWCAALAKFREQGRSIQELHFIGHSGLYGIMFGTTAWPEQFSPHEWQELDIPFVQDAQAFFHACRTARWFAAFFAHTFQVRTHGYYWYTTISTSPDRFVWEGLKQHPSIEQDLYVVSCHGRKSHGLSASLKKYLGRAQLEPMRAFGPEDFAVDRSYDKVAQLYDEAFADIRVRQQEWQWVLKHLPEHPEQVVLDIGCGNGSLLRHLSDQIGTGIGVDASQAMVAAAEQHEDPSRKLSFQQITGPSLPCEAQSCDVVISFMSFRYLDWDPMLEEIARVLKPDGKLLIIDMAAKPLRLLEWPRYVLHRMRDMLHRLRNPAFHKALRALTQHPDWKAMLAFNPIRAFHEYRNYLESRFPGQHVQTINLGKDHRIVAFDSGAIRHGRIVRQSYP